MNLKGILKNRVFNKEIAKIVSTVFYLGYIPLFPSSSIAGSLIGGMIVFLTKDFFHIQVFLIILLFLIGVYFSEFLIESKGNPDPPEIIIDEVCGIMIAIVGIPFKVHTIVLAYFFFHLFDAIKIFPLRKLEKLPLGWGVMTDDVMAGIYTNLIIRCLGII
jgi:phosphatidylglycerophosphatase A